MSPRTAIVDVSVAVISADIHCELGEGPLWVSNSNSLYWVDILGGKIYQSDGVDSATLVSTDLAKPSAIIAASNNRFLVTAGDRIFAADSSFDSITEFAKIPNAEANNRCNDAKCDPFGNLWVGTMDETESTRTGMLWCIDGHGQARLMLERVGISNTLAWDVKRERFYFADSMVGDIYVFDYDPHGPSIRNRRVFFSNGRAPGVPDGSAIDSHGFLWNARWDGSCVVRISPDGELDRVVQLPATRPTSCAFGGPGLDSLFVTSASLDAQDSARRSSSSGAVFRVNVDVRGQPIPEFELFEEQAFLA